jgi:hypothetical protein
MRQTGAAPGAPALCLPPTSRARTLLAASACGLLLCLAPGPLLAQTPPVLKFNTKIPGYEGGSGEPSTWMKENTYNASMLYVYSFRPFSGDFDKQFRQTLLRELITVEQEQRLVAPPVIKPLPIPGADATLLGRFVEDYWGTQRHRLRVAILARGAVAIVDYLSHDADSFQRDLAGLDAMVSSISVGSEQPAKPPSASQIAAAKSIAGLYLGSALQFVPSPVLGASPGSGNWMAGTRFYLLSATGNVYRGYRLPKAPDGDIHRFDFEKAKREDPGNSGVFAIEGGRVILRFGGGMAPEEQSSPLPQTGGPLEINGTTYKRQPIK